MLHHLGEMDGAVAGLPLEKRQVHCLPQAIAPHGLDANADLACGKDGRGHANIQQMPTELLVSHDGYTSPIMEKNA
jgi:hypothetical protein